MDEVALLIVKWKIISNGAAVESSIKLIEAKGF